MTEPDQTQRGLEWQVGVWDRMSDVYQREIDRRFAPIVKAVVDRATLLPGQNVLDLGTGTGAAGLLAAGVVGPSGCVTGVDISNEMLDIARSRARALNNVRWLEGAAERLPATTAEFDAVVACLSLMFVIDREAAAQEIGRVLRPDGCVVAAVWAGPYECDLVRFQQAAGRFAGPPPVTGVGPGALADTAPFLDQLKQAGIQGHVETETFGFDFPDFQSAWETFAGVTAARMSPERQTEAKNSVMKEMSWSFESPCRFQNGVQFIVGRKMER